MKHYTIEYKMYSADEVRTTWVLARTKEDAHDVATYVRIPKETGSVPYSAWVAGVTCQNGNYKRFNTFEGKPY